MFERQINEANGAARVSRAELEAQLEVLMLHQPVDQPLTTVLAYPKLRLRALMLILMA